ncbi:MAG TPA: endonuclease III [Bacteroidales bacterium]|nr:endonuclease III [Bacteroidales bacterium]
MTRKERYKRTIDYFLDHRPVAETELVHKDPYELIVAVILSAQCTDKRVNMITPALFRRYPDATAMSESDPVEILEYIKSCSYPNNKARQLHGMATMLVNEFNNVVPSDIDQLQKLPGVGRKTANVIASVVYNKPAMAVDTHVFRVANRIGLTINATAPLDAEIQLVNNIPEHLISLAHHWLILHGRYTCKARKPLCMSCGLTEFCRYYSKNQKETA